MIITGFDIETTGLDQSKGHRIIEIAASLYELETQTLKGKFVQRINPERSIDPGAQAVHGITFEMLTGCPTWEEVAPKLVKVFRATSLIVAHNGDGFDMPFVGGELLRVGQPVPDVSCYDTMLNGRWATPLGKVPSLKELCFACGVEYDPAKAHAADYDVDVMMESFFIGLNKGFFQIPDLSVKAAA